MRIIYNYIFDVTNCLKRDELIAFVVNFMKKNNITFQNVLFEISTYKKNDAKRLTYFEKLCEKDLFWRKYRDEYDCSYAKNTKIVGISNLIEGNWRKREIEKEDDKDEIVNKLKEQLGEMPECSYKIAFNEIRWFRGEKTKYPFTASGVPELYPLSSNITVMNIYPDKRNIILNFEMNSELKEYRKYIDDFCCLTGCTYTKDIQFVKNEKEREEYLKARLQISKLLEEIENTTINIDYSRYREKQSLHIKKTLKDIFCAMKLQYQGNGLYEIYTVDRYRNKLTIYFDYDKEQRSMCGTLSYRGVGFKYSIKYSEIKLVVCDEDIRQYASKVYDEVGKFVEKYVPQIMKFYKPAPQWFEWYEIKGDV